VGVLLAAAVVTGLTLIDTEVTAVLFAIAPVVSLRGDPAAATRAAVLIHERVVIAVGDIAVVADALPGHVTAPLLGGRDAHASVARLVLLTGATQLAAPISATLLALAIGLTHRLDALA
jgi:hypothetical protein